MPGFLQDATNALPLPWPVQIFAVMLFSAVVGALLWRALRRFRSTSASRALTAGVHDPDGVPRVAREAPESPSPIPVTPQEHLSGILGAGVPSLGPVPPPASFAPPGHTEELRSDELIPEEWVDLATDEVPKTTDKGGAPLAGPHAADDPLKPLT